MDKGEFVRYGYTVEAHGDGSFFARQTKPPAEDYARPSGPSATRAFSNYRDLLAWLSEEHAALAHPLGAPFDPGALVKQGMRKAAADVTPIDQGMTEISDNVQRTFTELGTNLEDEQVQAIHAGLAGRPDALDNTVNADGIRKDSPMAKQVDGWREWNGYKASGPMPRTFDRVRIKCRDGTQSIGCAGDFDWGYDEDKPSMSNIIQYVPIK